MTVMDAIPVLLIIWAAIAACFLGLLAYKGQLTRYEEDQLFLSETVSHEQQLQTEIIRKVNENSAVCSHLWRRCSRHDRRHHRHLHLRRLAAPEVSSSENADAR